MKVQEYINAYEFDGRRTIALNLDFYREYIKDGKIFGKDVYVCECYENIPLDKLSSFEIAKVDITKKKIIYILLGSFACKFIDSNGWNFCDRWFEVASSCSKEMLEIWKDLHIMKMTQSNISYSGIAKTMKSIQ